MTKPLNDIRQQITDVDQQMLSLLARRRSLTLNVAEQKLIDKRPVRDTDREQDLLIQLIQQGEKLGLDAHFVTQVFHDIIEDSVLNQQAFLQRHANPELAAPLHRVAFLGAPGSYSYLATHKYFARRPGKVMEIGCNSFQKIIDTVESGEADYGVLPIENTTSGSINDVFDVMQHTSVNIIGEVTHPIRHCLLGKAELDISAITTLYAHPQVYAQCSHYIAGLQGVQVEFCDSTSSAIAKVSQLKDGCSAAIGSQAGGELYGLRVLKSDLANQKENHSRFIVVARKSIDVPVQVPAKTTIILSVPQQPGALVDALLILRQHNINMSKLESRPITGNPWEEMFYVDVLGNINETNMQQAVSELTGFTRYCKILGCYPTETVMPTVVNSEPSVTKAPKGAPMHSQAMIRIGQQGIGSQQFSMLAKGQDLHQQAQLEEHGQRLRKAGAKVLTATSASLNSLTLHNYVDVCRKLSMALAVEIRHATEVKPALGLADAFVVQQEEFTDAKLIAVLGQSHRPVILQSEGQDLSALKQAADAIVEKGNRQVILSIGGNNALDMALLADWVDDNQYLILSAPDVSNLPATAGFTLAQAIRAKGVSGIILDVSNADQQQQYQNWCSQLS